jgi:hypothetical protein
LYKQGVPKWNYSTPATKRKDGKMGLHEIKKLLHNKKKIVSKLKRPPTKLEKIFAGYTSDKGLTTKIYRELQKLNSPKINEPKKKWATELNRTFSKEKVKMTK